jgi:hypothetical protein
MASDLATKGRKFGQLGVAMCVPAVALSLIGVLSWNTERQYRATVELMSKEANEVPAVIVKRIEPASQHSGRVTSTTNWSIQWRRTDQPDAKPVWEDVFETEIEAFQVGQKVTVWILADEHFVKKRLDYHTPQESWPCLVPGIILLVVAIVLIIWGIRLGRAARRIST